jgi:beta-galactosidase/beta-glucuronidase
MNERSRHPRPDRFRPHWWLLDGSWDFSFDDSDRGVAQSWFDAGPFEREIRVPFPHQAQASGIGDTDFHPVVWYRLRVPVPDAERGRLLLHFGAVDQLSTVWIDGKPVGQNAGGYVPFAIDITDFAGDERTIVVRAEDRTAGDRPRGKQIADPDGGVGADRGIRYTASTGIWQSVWIERVGTSYIEDFELLAAADGTLRVSATLGGDARALALVAELSFEGQQLARIESQDARFETRMADITPWSPGRPALYDLALTLVDGDQNVDRLETRIGFRSLETHGGQVLLNGEPIVFRMLLDQGYWPEGLTTPPSDEAIRFDLAWLAEAGFNGVRKHQKFEDPRFWHWADELGLLVWQDMPAAKFDASLADADHEHLLDEWERGIRRDRNHPSAVCWSPFNESWTLKGVRHDPALQQRVREAVARTRALAPTALVVDNSGWHHVDTDIFDLHNYEADPERLTDTLERAREQQWTNEWRFEFEAQGDLLKFAGADGWVRHDSSPLCEGSEYRGQPVMLSEFGGVGCVLTGDSAHPNRHVYTESKTPEDLARALENLVGAVEAMGFAGWCWTQLTDIEQEENGLLTYDRRPKIPAAQIAEILARAAARRPQDGSP